MSEVEALEGGTDGRTASIFIFDGGVLNDADIQLDFLTSLTGLVKFVFTNGLRPT